MIITRRSASASCNRRRSRIFRSAQPPTSLAPATSTMSYAFHRTSMRTSMSSGRRGLNLKITINDCMKNPSCARAHEGFFMQSRIHAANLGRLGYASHGQQVRAHAQIRLLFERLQAYSLIGAFHDAFQALVDLVLGPEETLQVQH